MKRAREGGIEVPDWIARLPIAAESTQLWVARQSFGSQGGRAWLKTLNADNVSDLFTTLHFCIIRDLGPVKGGKGHCGTDNRPEILEALDQSTLDRMRVQQSSHLPHYAAND